MSIFTPDGLSVEHRAFIGAHGGERVVAVRPSIVRALKGHASAAILLSQFVWWANQTRDPDGWFWPDQKQLMDETGLSEEQQARARKALWALGLGEEKRVGLPAKLHYRLNLAAVIALIVEAERVRNLDSALPGIFTPHPAESLPRESRNLYKDARASQRKEELKEELKECVPRDARPREATDLPIDSQPPAAFDAEGEALPNDLEERAGIDTTLTRFDNPPPVPPKPAASLGTYGLNQPRAVDGDALHAAVLKALGNNTATRLKMGTLPIKRQMEIKAGVAYLRSQDYAPADVERFVANWPNFLNNPDASPPKPEQLFGDFERVRDFKAPPPKFTGPPALSWEESLAKERAQMAKRDAENARIEAENARFFAAGGTV